jgi:hypothetical protein
MDVMALGLDNSAANVSGQIGPVHWSKPCCSIENCAWHQTTFDNCQKLPSNCGDAKNPSKTSAKSARRTIGVFTEVDFSWIAVCGAHSA